MSEQKQNQIETTQPDDVLNDSHTSLLSIVKPSSVSYRSQNDSHELDRDADYMLTNNDSSQSDTDEMDERNDLSLFYKFLIWLVLLLAVASLWQLMGMSSEVSQLNKNFDRQEVSLSWLEDNQGKYKTQVHDELSQYQTQFDSLRRNLEFGGIYGNEMQLKTHVGQLDGRLKELERRLSQSTDVANVQRPEIVQITVDPLNTLKGKWAINLKSLDGLEKSARNVADDFNKEGIPATMSTISVADKTWYRIFISGFGTYEDARRYGEDVLLKREIKNYWIRLEE